MGNKFKLLKEETRKSELKVMVKHKDVNLIFAFLKKPKK